MCFAYTIFFFFLTFIRKHCEWSCAISANFPLPLPPSPPSTPWISCSMVLRFVEHFWCSYPLRDPSANTDQRQVGDGWTRMRARWRHKSNPHEQTVSQARCWHFAATAHRTHTATAHCSRQTWRLSACCVTAVNMLQYRGNAARSALAFAFVVKNVSIAAFCDVAGRSLCDTDILKIAAYFHFTTYFLLYLQDEGNRILRILGTYISKRTTSHPWSVWSSYSRRKQHLLRPVMAILA